MARGADNVHMLRRLKIAVQIGKHKQFAAARAHFLHIGFHLVQQAIFGCNHHHRHIFVHQREWSVFQLACGIGLGVDVRDFFQLQCAFQRDRVMNAAPQE